MKFCQKCGTQNVDEASVCTNCGNSFVAQPDVQQNQVVNIITEKPKKKKKKKLLIAIALIIVVLFFIGIGNSNSESNSDDTTAGQISAAEAGKISSFNVTIKDSRIAKNSEGEPVLIVTYSFTNNSNNAAAFLYSVSEKLYQNGVELSAEYFTYGIDDYNVDDASKEIKPGVTFDVQRAYVLNDTETDVDVEISDYLSILDPITYTITLK